MTTIRRLLPLYIPVLLVLLALLTAADKPTAAAPVSGADLLGKAAPDFTLTDYDGKEHKLSEYTSDGKIVVLEWFNYGCPVVNAYYGADGFVDEATAALQTDKVVWLSINSGAPGKQGHGKAGYAEWLKKYKKSNPVLEDADGKVGKLYAAQATPTLFVVNAKGQVSYFGSWDGGNGPGSAGQNDNLVIAAVNSLLKGIAIAVNSTRPFGCSVKYADV